MTTGKTTPLTIRTFVGKVMSLLFNMLSRLVIAFLSRSKRLLISRLQAPSAVILEPHPEISFSPWALPDSSLPAPWVGRGALGDAEPSSYEYYGWPTSPNPSGGADPPFEVCIGSNLPSSLFSHHPPLPCALWHQIPASPEAQLLQ